MYFFSLKLLLQYGADPEPFEQICTCVPGWPLHHSVVYAHFPCFLELVRGGAITDLSLLPNQICSKIVARLSIPHAILKYAKWVQAGSNLKHNLQKGRRINHKIQKNTDFCNSLKDITDDHAINMQNIAYNIIINVLEFFKCKQGSTRIRLSLPWEWWQPLATKCRRHHRLRGIPWKLSSKGATKGITR